MTTRRKSASKTEDTVAVHEEQDAVEEVAVDEIIVEESIPQLYQSLVTIHQGGPHEPEIPIGHVQYLDRTGKLTGISSNPKYDVDLEVLVSGGLISKSDSSVVFSPRTKTWLLNIHNAVLPRNWKATEAVSRNEI